MNPNNRVIDETLYQEMVAEISKLKHWVNATVAEGYLDHRVSCGKWQDGYDKCTCGFDYFKQSSETLTNKDKENERCLRK